MTLKETIIAIGKEMFRSGMVAGTWGNLSVWDSERDGFWITPSGMDYLSMVTDDLVLLDLKGEIVEGKRRPSTELLMHLNIYKNRTDVKGVVHTHSIYATAHAVVRTSIPGIVEDLVQIAGGQVETAPYAPPGTAELADITVKTLGGRNAVLLANHGLVGVGSDLADAFKVCQVVEKTAQINIMSRLLGQPVSLSDEEISSMRQGYLTNYGQRE